MTALEHVLADLRVGFRAWKRSPGFAVVAVLTLALGAGATTLIFSIVHAVLLEPLPYRDGDRLAVVVAEQNFDGARQPVRVHLPTAAVAMWPAQGATVERFGFHAREVAALAGPAGSEIVDVAVVSGPYFETVGGEVVLGRGLSEADDQQPSVVISGRLWRRLYAGSASAIGRPITLTGQVFTIVGVAADTFQLPAPGTEAWIPAGVVRVRNANCCGFQSIARLKPGASIAAATDEIGAVMRTLEAGMPRVFGGVRVQVIPLHESIVRESRPALLVLSAAVALLLLLACANVMNLLLARNTARAAEIAVRRALGASRGRLVLQALAESSLLAGAGAAAGVALATAGIRALGAWAPEGLPRLEAVQINAVVLLFSLAVAVLSTLAVGLLPALQSGDAAAMLRATLHGRGTSGRARTILRAVTVGQLATSVVLLVGALLLGRSLAALLHTDLGIVPENVATASLNLAMQRTLTDAQQVELVDRVLERIASLPEVTAAGVGTARPPDASRVRLTLNRSGEPNARASFQAAGVPVTPGYFAALGIRLERGRFFTAADDRGHPPVAILSADTARLLFSGEDPLGRTIGLPVLRDGTSGREEVTIVGITANVKYAGIEQAADAVVYRPFAQQAWRSVFLVARTSGDPRTLASSLRREVAAVDRGITIAEVATLDDVLSSATSQPRFRSLLLAAFAAVAIAIAAIGLYGVIVSSVSQRTREIGVRMALGADRRRIEAMVLREGLMLAGLGAALGVASALGVSRLLTHFLYGIAPTDPLSFVLATAGIITAGLVSSYVPARRAAREDPLAALRAE